MKWNVDNWYFENFDDTSYSFLSFISSTFEFTLSVYADFFHILICQEMMCSIEFLFSTMATWIWNQSHPVDFDWNQFAVDLCSLILALYYHHLKRTYRRLDAEYSLVTPLSFDYSVYHEKSYQCLLFWNSFDLNNCPMYISYFIKVLIY